MNPLSKPNVLAVKLNPIEIALTVEEDIMARIPTSAEAPSLRTLMAHLFLMPNLQSVVNRWTVS
jgi:hypothetical protein